MKTRLVLWGTDTKDERVLVAIALNAKENKVDIWTFPEQVATETLYNRLINEWRMGKEIPFPQVFVQIERPLTTSEFILPDEIKIERPDLVARAQTEWQFVVLSARLYETYESELEHLKDKIEELQAFDKAIWEELKGFWDKVQEQIREKNLFRDHARNLRETTNDLFSKLKEKRKQIDEEFKAVSKENAALLVEKLKSIEERIEQGLGLQPLFEELKNLQKEYRDIKLTKDDRSKIWNRLDKAFKNIKERKYGPGYKKDFSALERLQRRYDGLVGAIEKMEKSIGRDKQDWDFQDKKIAQSEGQLEAQIRQAKLKMVEERIKSKEAKLSEMMKTKVELDGRMEVERKKDEERKVKAEVESRKAAVKEKIAEEMKHASDSLEDKAEDLRKAAEAITDKVTVAADKKIEDIKEAVEATSEKAEAKVEEMKGAGDAIAEEVEEKAEEKIEEAKEEAGTIADKVEETLDDLKKAAETIGDKVEDKVGEAETILSAAGDALGESLQDVADTVKAVAEVVSQQISEAITPADTSEPSDDISEEE